MFPEVARYRLGPFVIGSELDLPELDPLSETAEPNVAVRLGPVPDRIPNVVANETRWWASRTEYLQRVDGVAAFHVRDGREIVVQPHPSVPAGDVRAYLLAPIFSQLCFQAGMYALHGSAVRAADGVVAFLGDSGAGKSTLAAGLQQYGLAPVADDMCLLEEKPDAPISVIPVVPAIKLWRTALEHLGGEPAALPRVWSREDKYRLRMEAPEERPPLREILFLEWSANPDAAPEFLPVQPVDALTRMMALIHFEYLLKPTGRQARCFELCGCLLRQARVRVLRRPKNLALADAVARAVADDLNGTTSCARQIEASR